MKQAGVGSDVYSRKEMINLSRLLLVFAFLFTAVANNAGGQSSATALRADTQNWNDVQITVPVNERFDLLLLGTLRVGRHVTHPVDERAGAGFSFKFNKYLTVSSNYLYIGMQPVPGRKSYENRITGAATLRLPLGQFTFSDRNHFERRIRHPQVDATRYRDRLTIEHPLNLGGLKLQLFASDEIYYDWSAHDWVRNRFAVGVNRKFNRHFTLDLYYMRQNDGRTRPGYLDIIGAVYRIRL